MDFDHTKFKEFILNIYSLNTVIVGSGAAGLNAAHRLHSYGQTDIAVVSEGLKKGTSRNAGSDKQTYYKLTQGGDNKDSVYEMAKTLYNGGAVNGDIALVEAAMSSQCFYHLVELGIPFPHNIYGEYIGYRTDYDPMDRAISAGPCTSKYITDALEEKIRQEGIKVFDGYQVISILTDKAKKQAVGLLALNLNNLENPHERYVLFNSVNIIYATGGPAGMYLSSVYPESQMGSSGIAFEAGIKGVNLTEWQFGIASKKFRWNLSGSYQQVIPRYISTDSNGNDEIEFLDNYFSSSNKLVNAVFNKGYQWPFNPKNVINEGSSVIDLLVYAESVLRGRRVFLDYTKNSKSAGGNGGFDFSLLKKESLNHLKDSNALLSKPIDRLRQMNQPAVDLFMDNGINLKKEYLEIAVCVQHNNGGLEGDIWWQSNLKHFFPVGEVNGSHGVYRPGGSALNSGQVGSTRAAYYISNKYNNPPLSKDRFLDIVQKQIDAKIKIGEILSKNCGFKSNVMHIRKEIGIRMDSCGGIIRNPETVNQGVKKVKDKLRRLIKETKLSSIKDLGEAFKNYDLLLAQYVYLESINNYIQIGGKSRGSCIICEPDGEIDLANMAGFCKFSLDNGKFNNKIQEVSYIDGKCKFNWFETRPIPEREQWFEKVWRNYRGEISTKK